ncbi:hypothetical protein [Streptomyces sp. YIM S03343]
MKWRKKLPSGPAAVAAPGAAPGLWGDGGAYQTWVGFLRAWAAFEPVDPEALPRLEQEQFEADTWVRLSTHVIAAFTARLARWSEGLVRALNEARDEFSFGRELAQARTGLRSVRALAAHPGLPESLRTELGKLIDEQIPRIQAQLEQSLEHEARRGANARFVEQRRRTLRDNALTAVLTTPPDPASAPPADPWASYTPGTPSRRRVLPD